MKAVYLLLGDFDTSLHNITDHYVRNDIQNASQLLASGNIIDIVPYTAKNVFNIFSTEVSVNTLYEFSQKLYYNVSDHDQIFISYPSKGNVSSISMSTWDSIDKDLYNLNKMYPGGWSLEGLSYSLKILQTKISNPK